MSNGNIEQTEKEKQSRRPRLNFSEMGIPMGAENADLDFIVTEKLKDFKRSKVRAISIESALEKFGK